MSCILVLCLAATTSLASSRQTVLETLANAQDPYDPSAIESVQPVNDTTVLSRERDQRGTFRVWPEKNR